MRIIDEHGYAANAVFGDRILLLCGIIKGNADKLYVQCLETQDRFANQRFAGGRAVNQPPYGNRAIRVAR